MLDDPSNDPWSSDDDDDDDDDEDGDSNSSSMIDDDHTGSCNIAHNDSYHRDAMGSNAHYNGLKKEVWIDSSDNSSSDNSCSDNCSSDRSDRSDRSLTRIKNRDNDRNDGGSAKSITPMMVVVEDEEEVQKDLLDDRSYFHESSNNVQVHAYLVGARSKLDNNSQDAAYSQSNSNSSSMSHCINSEIPPDLSSHYRIAALPGRGGGITVNDNIYSTDCYNFDNLSLPSVSPSLRECLDNSGGDPSFIKRERDERMRSFNAGQRVKMEKELSSNKLMAAQMLRDKAINYELVRRARAKKKFENEAAAAVIRRRVDRGSSDGDDCKFNFELQPVSKDYSSLMIDVQKPVFPSMANLSFPSRYHIDQYVESIMKSSSLDSKHYSICRSGSDSSRSNKSSSSSSGGGGGNRCGFLSKSHRGFDNAIIDRAIKYHNSHKAALPLSLSSSSSSSCAAAAGGRHEKHTFPIENKAIKIDIKSPEKKRRKNRRRIKPKSNFCSTSGSSSNINELIHVATEEYMVKEIKYYSNRLSQKEVPRLSTVILHKKRGGKTLLKVKKPLNLFSQTQL